MGREFIIWIEEVNNTGWEVNKWVGSGWEVNNMSWKVNDIGREFDNLGWKVNNMDWDVNNIGLRSQ